MLAYQANNRNAWRVPLQSDFHWTNAPGHHDRVGSLKRERGRMANENSSRHQAVPLKNLSRGTDGVVR